MTEELRKRLKLKKDVPVREEVDLNIMIASALLDDRFEKLISKFGITGSQYNVLRILRGVYPDGHPRCEISMRMIRKAPDITRLIDRLEKQGLVKRDRSDTDRRMSITRITEKGLRAVEEITPHLHQEHKKITKDLTQAQCGELSNLLEKLYRNMI